MMNQMGAGVARAENLTSEAVPSAPAAIDAEAFLRRIQRHQANVKALALALWERFHRDFNGLHLSDLEAYLDLHDAPKVYDLETLRGLGYQGNDTFLERLRPLFGVNLSQVDAGAADSFSGLIRELNEIEREEKIRLMDALGIAAHARRHLVAIETAADVADTRLSPSRREELAIPWHAPGPAEYLAQVMGREDIAPYAEWLEARYEAIIRLI